MVSSVCPIQAPYTVALADPVDARFPTLITLSATSSTEYPIVTLPCRVPPLTVTRKLLPIPSSKRPRTLVSELHVVDSHALPPTFIPTDTHDPPIPAPCSVTLADPDPPAFLRPNTLSCPASPDRP